MSRYNQILYMSMDMFFFSTSVNTPFFVFSPENIPISHPLLFPFSQYGAQDTAFPYKSPAHYPQGFFRSGL
ncbi:MAG: hypothetical protein ACLR0N_16670, partial [Bilophila wadsworthia]